MSSSTSQHEQQASIICKTIESGHLDSAFQLLQHMEHFAEEDKLSVFLMVKHYSRYLTDYVQENGLSLSTAWKTNEIKDSPTRSGTMDILKNMFKGGLSSNVGNEEETALMSAVGTHDEDLVRLLMENGADPNVLTSVNEMNAIALAIILNDASVLKLILSYGRAKVNTPCCQSLTPLQLSMNKAVEVSKLLLQNGADVQQVIQMRGSNGILLSKPPLIHAVETDNLYMASILLEHDEDINQYYGDCANTPIHFAVLRGNDDMVKLLLQYGGNLDKRNNRGYTALGLALHQMNSPSGKNISQSLIDAGCNWNKSSVINVFMRHFPPIHIAAFLGYDFHLDIIKCLLEKSKQAEVQEIESLKNIKRDSTKMSELSQDMRRRQSIVDSSRIVADMQKVGQQKFINTQAMDKSTALFMSVLGGNVKIANYLYDNGADPYITCCLGNLLHAAVMASKFGEEMLKFAFQFNFDLNVLNDDGNTPLTLAARNSNPQLCRALVEHGAELNIRDGKFGETALSVSVYFGFEDSAETLICHGANTDIPDSRGMTTLYWAIFNCRQKTLKLLLEAGATLTRAELVTYPKNIKVMRDRTLRGMLQDYVSRPTSLQQSCRLSIRKQLVQVHCGKSIMAAVMSLPVPQKLKHFLALKTV